MLQATCELTLYYNVRNNRNSAVQSDGPVVQSTEHSLFVTLSCFCHQPWLLNSLYYVYGPYQ
jgi:hypothetical protein